MIHPIRQQQLDRQKMREDYKDRFTVLAIFDGIKPCGRCGDPYCINNLPHYERWDLLKPLLEKIDQLARTKYKGCAFSIVGFHAGTSIDEAVDMAVGFINYHNSLEN